MFINNDNLIFAVLKGNSEISNDFAKEKPKYHLTLL
jgi:hypothetical protein